MDNLELWNAVCETDPNDTKRITQRGGFTAIDAYSQIYAATEQFGAAGKGWGWEIIEFQYPNESIIIHIRLWHGTRDNFIDVVGQKDLMKRPQGKDPKPDEDAAKKALTDAITKGLSYFGFNADVFMGKFDDNKYVEGLKEKREQTSQAQIDNYGGTPEKLHEWLLEEIRAATTVSEYEKAWGLLNAERTLLGKVSPELMGEFKKACGLHRAQIEDAK